MNLLLPALWAISLIGAMNLGAYIEQERIVEVLKTDKTYELTCGSRWCSCNGKKTVEWLQEKIKEQE